MKERVIGVIIIAGGALLAYLCIYEPLQGAKNHEPDVTVSAKGAILAPLGLIGVLYLVLGERANRIMGTREKPAPAAYVVCFSAAAIGVAIYVWLRMTLEAQGYDFGGQL